MFMKKLLFILSMTILACLSSCKNKSETNLTFVFMGDLHYKIPDYRTAEYLVPSFVKELDTLKVKPEFILLTGDFFHGSRGTDIESESDFAFRNFSENINMPFFIAKGNHDSREHFERNALPLFSDELGKEVSWSYYSFDKANCHFIILDCTDEDLTVQLSWLEKDLETAKSDPSINHIFVASHYPLWIVARAGFTRPEYATPVAALLAKYKVDAYFCGHTHNKTLTVRTIDGQPLTQIMDAGVVEEKRLTNLAPFLLRVKAYTNDVTRPGILPLEEGHQIFIPQSVLKYYWGYQEGSTTSYYLITVKGKSVQADWHVLNQGIVRSVKWDQPGILQDLKVPAAAEKYPLTDSNFRQIEKAWLYTAPWIDKDSTDAPFQINEIPSGVLHLSKVKMAASPFWNKIEVPLDSSAIACIKRDNEIIITNPAKSKFGLAHMFLLVKFKDGHFARSSISQKVLTSFTALEGEYPNFPDSELIEAVVQGEKLAKTILSFDYYYKE